MSKKYTEITKFEGESAFIATQDAPSYIFQKLENLRPSVILGDAVKRDGYTEKITGGIGDLQTMIEFTDKNGTAQLAVIDGDGFEVYTNSDGTYATRTFTDENTGTIDGDNTQLISFNNEVRGGVGIRTASTGDKPLWYGWNAGTTRFPDSGDPVTITADEYLDEQFYEKPLASLIEITGSFDQSYVTDKGIENKKSIIVYAAPVYDGYQKGMPEKISETDNLGGHTSAYHGILKIDDAKNSSDKRITAIDLFVAETEQHTRQDDLELLPAYFLERLQLSDDGGKVLEFSSSEVTYDDSAGSENILIADYADWYTFDLTGFYLYEKTRMVYYRITSCTTDGTSVKLETSPTLGDPTSDNIEIFPRWYDDGSDYIYHFIYDKYHRSPGSEMFTYLNLPFGDLGLTDYKYKYLAWNGDRAAYGGGSDTNFSYFSSIHSPDIVPALNIVRHKANIRGIDNIGQDFLYYTDIGIERVSVINDGDSYQNEEYLNAILVSNRAKTKIDDNTVILMSYQGPILISGRTIDSDIGLQEREWWLETFTKAQMEACIVGYNFKEQEVWFSFPTYTTSPYTNGIIFVFDLKAFRMKYSSAWWRVKTDSKILAFALNSQYNLLGGVSNKVIDFNTAGTETVSTALKLKMLSNPLISKKGRYDSIYVDNTSSDTIAVDCYFDEAGSADLSLTLNADETAFMKYMAKTLEVELTTSASTNDLAYHKIQISQDLKKT